MEIKSTYWLGSQIKDVSWINKIIDDISKKNGQFIYYQPTCCSLHFVIVAIWNWDVLNCGGILQKKGKEKKVTLIINRNLIFNNTHIH